jgi:hypothetical protein
VTRERQGLVWKVSMNHIEGRYSVAYADPPWHLATFSRKGKAVAHPLITDARHFLRFQTAGYERCGCGLCAPSGGRARHQPEREGDGRLLMWAQGGHAKPKHALMIDDLLPRRGHDAGSSAILGHIQALQALGWQVEFVPARELAAMRLADAVIAHSDVEAACLVREAPGRAGACRAMGRPGRVGRGDATGPERDRLSPFAERGCRALVERSGHAADLGALPGDVLSDRRPALAGMDPVCDRSADAVRRPGGAA